MHLEIEFMNNKIHMEKQKDIRFKHKAYKHGEDWMYLNHHIGNSTLEICNPTT